MKNNVVFALIAAVAIAILGLVWFFMPTSQPSDTDPDAVACTMEAKICPDGSAVGRSGPKCEFAACPSSPTSSTTPTVPPTDPTASWKTMTDRATGVTFNYPASLPTTYIHTAEWPPKVRIEAKRFICNENGSGTSGTGQTTKVVLDGLDFCVTHTSEGAAGSIYTTYAYAFPRDNSTITLTFTLRAVQCGNYDDPQKTACESERATFDIDALIDQMVHTLTTK